MIDEKDCIIINLDLEIEDEVIDFIFEDNSNDIELSFDEEINNIVSKEYPDYLGTYEVTPKVTEIILPTKNKTMKKNVTVFQIPYAEVSNAAGGKTVTIGLE